MENLKIVKVRVNEKREIIVEAITRDCKKFYEYYKIINGDIYFNVISAYNLGNILEETIILKYVLPRLPYRYTISDAMNYSRELKDVELIPVTDNESNEKLNKKLKLL